MSLVGNLIDGYTIVEELYRGGPSTYYKATKDGREYLFQHISDRRWVNLSECSVSTEELMECRACGPLKFCSLKDKRFVDPVYLVWVVHGFSSARLFLEKKLSDQTDLLAFAKVLISVLQSAHQRQIFHGGLSLENVFVRNNAHKVMISEFSLFSYTGTEPAANDLRDAALIIFTAATGERFSAKNKESFAAKAKRTLAVSPIFGDMGSVIMTALDYGFKDASTMLAALESCSAASPVESAPVTTFVKSDEPRGYAADASSTIKTRPSDADNKKTQIADKAANTADSSDSETEANLAAVADLYPVWIDSHELKEYERWERNPAYDPSKPSEADEYDAKYNSLLTDKERDEMRHIVRLKHFKPSDVPHDHYPAEYEYNRLYKNQTYGVYNNEEYPKDGQILGRGGYAVVVYRRKSKTVRYVQKILDYRYPLKNEDHDASWQKVLLAAKNELMCYQTTAQKRTDVSARLYAASSATPEMINRILAKKEHTKQIILEMEAGLSFIPFMYWFVQREDFLKHILYIIRDLFVLLHEFHKTGYIHTDIKPSNIVLFPSKDSYKPVFIDFNSAQKINEKTENQIVPDIDHTEYYVPPERRNWDGHTLIELTPAYDVYSMGLIVYELLNEGRRMDEMDLDKYEKAPRPKRLRELGSVRNFGRNPTLVWNKLTSKLMSCLKEDRHARPTTEDMIDTLNKLIK